MPGIRLADAGLPRRHGLHDDDLGRAPRRPRARCPDLRLGLPRRRPLHRRTHDDRRPSRVLARTARCAPPTCPTRSSWSATASPASPPASTSANTRPMSPASCSSTPPSPPSPACSTTRSSARVGTGRPVPPRSSRSPPGQTSPSRSSSTTLPSTPHDKVWSDTVEAQWGTDEAAFAALAPHGTVHVARLRSRRLPRRVADGRRCHPASHHRCIHGALAGLSSTRHQLPHHTTHLLHHRSESFVRTFSTTTAHVPYLQ